MATQNPVEQHRTYPLPEAQLDRFLLKLRFDYPDAEDLVSIVTDSSPEALEALAPLADSQTWFEMNALAHTVPASSQVSGYLARLLLALQPTHDTAPAAIRENVRLGPSPRGGHSLMMAARVSALLDGRPNVALRDIPALRQTGGGSGRQFQSLLDLSEQDPPGAVRQRRRYRCAATRQLRH